MKIIYRAACFAAGAALVPAAPAQTIAEAPLAMQASDPKLEWGPCPPIFSRDCAIAVLHGDPGKPNADIFLRLRGGAALPAHRHTSAERMILVSGRLRVDYQGAAPTIISPGSYAYGPAGLPHSASCMGKQACTLFIAFEGPVDAVLDAGGVD